MQVRQNTGKIRQDKGCKIRQDKEKTAKGRKTRR